MAIRKSIGLYSWAIEFVENGGVPAKVEDLAFHGLTTLYALRLKSGGRILSECPSHFNFHPGDNVNVEAMVKNLILFPAA